MNQPEDGAQVTNSRVLKERAVFKQHEV